MFVKVMTAWRAAAAQRGACRRYRGGAMLLMMMIPLLMRAMATKVKAASYRRS
jgi:hypothetical protein